MPIDKKIHELIKKQYEANKDYYLKPYVESRVISGLTFGQVEPEAREPRSQFEKILGTGAEFAAMTPGFGVASKIAGAGMKLAGLTGTAARIGTEAGMGAIIGAIEPAEDERERVAHVLENAAIFGAFGVGAEGLKGLVKKIRGVKDIKKPLADDEIGDIINEVMDKKVSDRVVSYLPVRVRNRFQEFAEKYSVQPRQLSPRPQRVVKEDILGGYGGVRQQMGEGLYLKPGERRALPEGIDKTLAGEKGIVRGPISLKRLDLKEGDIVVSKKSKKAFYVANQGKGFVSLREPGVKGVRRVPLAEFRKDYAVSGRGFEPISDVAVREELEAVKPVSREIVERPVVETPGALTPVEETKRYKKWKEDKTAGKPQISFAPEAELPRGPIKVKPGQKSLKRQEGGLFEVKRPQGKQLETQFYETLERGDEFKIGGEKFKVAEKTPTKLIVKNGITHELEPGFSPLGIDEGTLKKPLKKKGKVDLEPGVVALSDVDRKIVETEMEALRQGKYTTGGLRRDKEGNVIGRFKGGNTNPKWFTEGGFGTYGKKPLLNIMQKSLDGKKLTPKQRSMMEEALAAMRTKHAEPGMGGSLYAVSPAGMAAGIEQDEEGKYRLNPAKAMAGVLGTAALGMAATRVPGFYSKLERIIKEKMPNRAAVQDVKNIIMKGGVKAEEIEVSGIEKWLEKQGKAVTKDDVVKYVQENQVQVREVIKGKTPELVKWEKEFNRLGAEENRLFEELKYLPGDDFTDIWKNFKVNKTVPKELRAKAERAVQIGKRLEDLKKSRPANAELGKFSQYTLPGGENYRELLITLPRKFPSVGDYLKQKGYPSPGTEAHMLAIKEYEKLYGDIIQRAKGDYKSSHWDEPNVLAHVRFNERVDSEGKKVLFIEEIQSDWHQAGRKTGYQNVEAEKRLNVIEKRLKEIQKEAKIVDDDFEGLYKLATKDNEYSKLAIEGQALRKKYYGESLSKMKGVPDAPFKKNWPDLAMKRMMRYASDNGFDRIAWTTGRQQAERYDLRKVIQEVSYYPKNKQLIAKDLNGSDAIKQIVEPNKLDDYIGKEAAEKLLNSPLKKEYSGIEYYNISGEQLAVGGEGMNAFYDQMLPNMMNKLGKKYGARVGETSIKVPRSSTDIMTKAREGEILKPEKVMYLDITPALKKEAQERGFPMFSVAGGLAGFSQDEQGNIKFDPKYALLGMIGGTLAGKALGAKSAKKLIDKMYKLKGDGIKFLEKQFDFRMGKLAEMDQKKAKALDDIVDGMLERQGTHPPSPSLGKRGGVKAAAEIMGADMRKKLEELISSRGTGAFRNAMKQGKVLGKSLEDLTQKQAIKIEKILSQMPERISKATRAAEGVIDQGATIEGERGTVRRFFKDHLEKTRKWLDASIDTPFDRANLTRYGESAWKKGQHGNFARELDIQIKKDVKANIPGITTNKALNQATADFKSAVTINLERGQFDPLRWNKVYSEAIERVQDPATKDFLKRVKRLVDEGSPMLKEYTEMFRKDFEGFKEILADEGLKKEFIENYVTHLWNMKGGSLASSRMALKTQFQYAKERLMPSYLEGIAAGLKPQGLDIVYINEHYKKSLETVLANRRFVQHLKSLSVEMPNMDKFKMVIDSKAFEALPGFDQRMYTTVNHRAFSGTYVHSQVAKDLRNIFETSKWRDVWYGKGYLRINQYMKRMKLAASGFHFVALGFNNMFYHKDKWWKIGNPLPFDLFNWKSGYKEGLEAYWKKNPILEHGVRSGLTLDEAGAMADYYYKFKRNMMSWPQQKGGLGEIKELGKHFVELWDDALWGKYYVGSKAQAFMVEYGRNLKFLEKRYPKLYEEWKAKGFAKTFQTEYEKKAAQFASRDINDLYGGLNYELLKISQTTQDTLRAFVLAPDWQTSNWRSFINGVRGMATGGQSAATVAAGKRLAQVAITLGGLGNMINYVTTGRFVWDNPQGYKGMVAIGEIDGKPYYTDFYRHFGEFMKVFKYGTKGKPATYIYDSPLRYLVNKSSQLVRVVDAIRTGEDWRGRPLADWKALMQGKMSQSKWTPWYERGSVLPGVVLQIGEAFIPIPGQTLQRSIIGDEPWVVGGSSVFGIHIKEYKGDKAKWKPKVRGGIRGVKGIGGVGGYGGF